MPSPSGPDPEEDPATRLLQRMRAGDAAAEAELFGVIYAELRSLAARHMRRQHEAHTLQPTALVHEAWMRLADRAADAPRDRAHFMALASRAMRSVLVDHARRRKAAKRGGERERVSLDVVLDAYEARAVDLVALDDALERLGAEDAELMRLVELRFFGGLAMDETAEALGVSLSTAERRWRLARLWLRGEVADG